MSAITLQQCLERMPLVAILRGVEPDEVLSIGEALMENDFRIIEVPLNSPAPLDSIRLLAEALGERALVGAGTVLSPDDARDVADAGGRLVVMPHSDGDVIRAGKQAGCVVLPGVATPTEAFAALDAGADGLKLFPAEAAPPAVLKAWRAILPKQALVLPVGGITPDNMDDYRKAGANGFGLGSALYKAGDDAETVARSAKAFAEAVNYT